MVDRKLFSWQLLELIEKHPGSTAPELRKRLGVSTNSNLTAYFKRLMEKKLITRTKDISVEPYTPWYRYYPTTSNIHK